MLMMSPPISSLTNNNTNNNNNNNNSNASTKNNSASGALTTNVSSSLNSLTINNTTSNNQEQQQQQQQQSNTVYMVPTVPNSFSYSQNAVRKRKIKFTVQLAIQELLSVPYLNAVLFCKVRQCDGGNHVSYSSKKEISNSSVLWTDDAPIQFEVKTIQSYVTNPSNVIVIIGYDQCLCRVSVRKELRGGKSYQKIGYVDFNLTDFLTKYNDNNNTATNENEFCVNRILKEYDSTEKKNQQRLDNSYLKIKIKILDSNLPPTQINIKNVASPNNQATGPPSPPSTAEPLTNSSTPVTNQSPTLLTKSINNINNNPSSLVTSNQNYTPTHSRHSSSSTTNSILANGNLNNTSLSSVFANGHYRSCSNGSIKSNVSFEFLSKNRNKKLMEELNSTSSSNSLTQVLNNVQNNDQQLQASSSSNLLLLTPTNTISSPLASVITSASVLNKIEPANIRLIETRVDPNEIINQIENELANRFSNLKPSSNTAASSQQNPENFS